jgi:hypothetical protein
MVRLVDVRENPSKNTNTIESIAFRSKFGIGERRMVLEDIQSRRDSKEESLEVLYRGISSSTNVGAGEEGEYIFNGLREFPELIISTLHIRRSWPDDIHLSNTDRWRGCSAPPRA